MTKHRVSVHRPFDDHTLQLVNAAVWFVESRRPNGRYEWQVIPENRGRKGAKLDESTNRAASSVEAPVRP
jgi:hypothetical protein